MKSVTPNLNQTKSTGRRGVVILEFILWFPVLVITLLAVVEFSLILAGAKVVDFSSRTGAKLAAETPNLVANAGTEITTITTAVNNELQSAGYGTNAAKGVRLQYNLPGGSGTVATGTCPQITSPALPSNSVRVVVNVDLSKFTPDMLGSYGFSTSGRTVLLSTTQSYEQ